MLVGCGRYGGRVRCVKIRVPARGLTMRLLCGAWGLNSACGEQMVMAFEDEFAVEIPDAEAEKIHTVEQAVNYIASHSQAK